MTEKEVVDVQESGLEFSLRVLLKHPRMSLEAITAATGVAPQLTSVLGEPRLAPNGVPLAGTHPLHVWSYWKTYRNQREFQPALVELLDLLEPAKPVLSSLYAGLPEEGAYAAVILELQGQQNIGDDITPAVLARLCALGLSLGIEVFPDANAAS